MRTGDGRQLNALAPPARNLPASLFENTVSLFALMLLVPLFCVLDAPFRRGRQRAEPPDDDAGALT